MKDKREAVFLCALLAIVLFIGLGTENSFAVASVSAGLPAAAIAVTMFLHPQRKAKPPVPPAKQVQQLSEKYGLPIVTPLLKAEPLPLVTAPSVSASGGHVCEGRYYQNVIFCARHWQQHLENTDANLAESQRLLDKSIADITAATLAVKQEREYEPAGHTELLATLLEYVRDQATEANRTRWSAGRKREWHISPEWLAEVEKLRVNGASGEPLWKPRKRQTEESLPGHLLGYPVVVASHFGTPELTAL